MWGCFHRIHKCRCVLSHRTVRGVTATNEFKILTVCGFRYRYFNVLQQWCDCIVSINGVPSCFENIPRVFTICHGVWKCLFAFQIKLDSQANKLPHGISMPKKLSVKINDISGACNLNHSLLSPSLVFLHCSYHFVRACRALVYLRQIYVSSFGHFVIVRCIQQLWLFCALIHKCICSCLSADRRPSVKYL